MTEQDILLEAAKVLNSEIVHSFREQGHHLTGAWENSIFAKGVGKNEVDGFALDYGSIVDAGTSPEKIPYSGNSGAGGVSKYIQGLFNFWKLRKPGCTDKEALSLAFATAKKQKQEGMSTSASQAFSATGERQQFIETAFKQTDNEVSGLVFNGLAQVVNEGAQEEPVITF